MSLRGSLSKRLVTTRGRAIAAKRALSITRATRRKPRRRASALQRTFPFASSPERLPQFWQKRFYDFNVWSRKKKIEKLGYMHANPLKRRLVDDPKRWPWSSYAFYQQRGDVLIPVDPLE